MGLITRRWFVQQTAFTAAALYGRPIKAFFGRAGLFGTNEQSATHIDPVAIRELASEITGHVITPDASDYESSRLVNNLAYDRHPALIVRCASASDVARALDFAQRHTLPLAVRGGGHSAGGDGVCDGGVVIDLSGMMQVEVDAGTRVARADAGCLVGHLDQAMQRFGLATPVGTCSTVGIAGLTLGGGEGALMPKYGATCDNLISAHVVTVDGRQIEASQNSNPDLFWAIRGGGGNFGVVTAFEYRLHPVSEVLAGTLSYPPGRIPELLHACAKFTETAPDELSVTGRILPSDDGPTFQILVEYCGQVSIGNDLLRPLRAQLKPRTDGVVATSHLEAQRKWFPAAKPSSFFVANVFLPTLDEATIAAIAAAIQAAPRRFMVLMPNFRGAVTRVSSTEMAFAMRQPGYEVDLFAGWAAQDGEEKEGAVRWVKALRDKLQPMSQGVYVNGMSETSDQLVRAAYGPNYARLVEIKKKYDPMNVLRLNQNIRPA